MKNDEVRVSLISSSDLKGDLDEIVILFRHRFVIFVLGAPIPVLALIAHRADGLPPWLGAAGYAAGLVALLASIQILLIGLRRIIRRPAVLRLPFLLLNIPAVLAAVAAAEVLSRLAGAAPREPLDLAAAALLIVVFLEASMALAGRSLLPAALAQWRATGGEVKLPVAPPPEPVRAAVPLSLLPASVQLGGRAIPLSDLSHITGEGNLVVVHFGSRSLRLSARFATIMVSLPDGTGMQINRMVWVSAPQAARSRLDRIGRETVLHLPDGTTLAVAPNRRAELAAWIRALQAMP